MKRISLFLLIVCVSLFISACGSAKEKIELMPYVEQQMILGPRTPGSEAHAQFIGQTVTFLEEAGWTVRCDEEKYQGKTIRNIIAERGQETTEGKWIVIGAHYDSRIMADQENKNADRQQPVPAANDGASGVAVLMGLAKTLPEFKDKKVTLAFFDAEDQGKIMGWPDWCLGSKALADQYGALDRKPDAVIVIDMIGDADLNIWRERNSDQALTDELFGIAAKLGYGKQFIDQEKYAMTDDHVPFISYGIPAADLIDFDYPWWHTLGDTSDKLSEESLRAVYDVLWEYLVK
ncbi:MAG: M28 family peptidase [Anaerolineaceae bacterium]|nr:M28 family peptidase [Anaerolineaceae bacterium]